MARAMELDEAISYDGSDFSEIPEGIWPFKVKGVTIGNYKGGPNIPPCKYANVALRVGAGAHMTDVNERIYLYVNDSGNPNWEIASYYRAIGYKKHGQEVKMDWSDALNVGKTGWCETENNEGNDGNVYTNLKRFIDPEDAPADGQPVIKGQQAQPQQAPAQGGQSWTGL